MLTQKEPHEWASEKALETYKEAKLCHLAHAILGTENILTRRFEGKPFAIQVIPVDSLRVAGRSTLYLRIAQRTAEIWVNRDLAVEAQRMAIAHELGHVLAACEKYGSGMGLPNRASLEDEIACNWFEKWLCARLHKLYTETSFTNESKFPSLDSFCRENNDFLSRDI